MWIVLLPLVCYTLHARLVARMKRRGEEESGVEASGMLAVRNTCDKRADNHKDGVCVFHVALE